MFVAQSLIKFVLIIGSMEGIKATFISVFIIFNTCVNLAFEIYRSSCRTDVLFKISNRDYKLDMGADKMLAIPSLSQCARKCVKRESCKSINYNPNSYECELLNASKSNGGSLVASVGWKHYEPLNITVRCLYDFIQ